MDPNEVFRCMLHYYQEGSWLEAIEQAEILSAWLKADGFAPQVAVSLPDASVTIVHQTHWFNRTVAEATILMILQVAGRACQMDAG